jgi:hypothetical protein
VIVALNTASATRTTNALATSFGAGVDLVDLTDTALPLATNGAGQLTLTVPARSSRLLTKRSELLRLDPVVLAATPRHDARTVPALTPVVLTFSEPMDTLAVMQDFTLTPTVFGRTGWSTDQRTFTFTPLAPLASGTLYTVQVGSGARDATGRPLVAAFRTFFRAGTASAPGVTVPQGYRGRSWPKPACPPPKGWTSARA